MPRPPNSAHPQASKAPLVAGWGGGGPRLPNRKSHELIPRSPTPVVHLQPYASLRAGFAPAPGACDPHPSARDLGAYRGKLLQSATKVWPRAPQGLPWQLLHRGHPQFWVFHPISLWEPGLSFGARGTGRGLSTPIEEGGLSFRLCSKLSRGLFWIHI